MTSRIASALLAVSLHGVVLLLLLAAWRGPQAGAQGPTAGQRLTSVSLAAARDDSSEPEPRRPPAPREAASVAKPVTLTVPSVSALSPIRPAALELPLPSPVQIAAHDGKHAEAASEPAAQAPSTSSAAGSGSGRPEASSAASDAAAPAPARARSSAGSNTYAVKVFRHILSKKEFPARLAQAGIRGRVLVRFNLTGAGEIIDIVIVRSSGVAALDGLALAQIRGAEPYPRPPKELGAAQLRFIVPMTYRPST